MKTTITIIILGFSLFVSTLWAGNDFLYNNSSNKKHKSKDAKVFDEGKYAASIGYGAGSGGFLKAILKSYQDSAGYHFSSFGPIHFRAEYGLSDKVGFALSVNYNSWKAGWTHRSLSGGSAIYHDEYKRSVVSILARINAHFGGTAKLDPYVGIGAGYRVVTRSFTSDELGYSLSFGNPAHLGFEATLGVRYYIAEGVGLYAEMGLAQSLFQGGLAVAF